ncbi:MAG: epimerase [Candidatus Schekmanbacteria bacterium RIFCSPHIGHO2_02_FULL_38_11]|uniref:Epimerase n=1 Tax=Candidatus Schekmanbacteria bacterium RIFCSPLOWO2_12_FULL_38_15 TaxID=1817883 RepID=A0A1F7SMH0_9BACT|nr:MAG: epimerase [Candidatus Schekmanbacteria bacterium RIFCSPLOWO2_02_FULL_38_14]OGL51351.1 MAG: epimerase [Candidatus Schekmanbacteria bacterium RIFCSPHIGHO2_02_FULL_38_11]OGL54404.1 MAG: epimerase [Candidatus Schekmanbacteria bacterium RIFCSPLOWO2_12_FULL_38_15]
MKTVLITGGAGYIGSLLTGFLLNKGYKVKVIDELWFGGESIMPYFINNNFIFIKGNVCEIHKYEELFADVEVVVHFAAIVGFPACQQVGKETAFKFNHEATKKVFDVAESKGIKRFILASTYSNYGISDDGKAVTEESPLYPQSIYAESKIKAEKYLLSKGINSYCAPVIPRFATLFGISPRTRFDLIVNQFVLEAMTKRKLIIYQKNYNRSFVHIRDVINAIYLMMEAEEDKIRNQIFNVGSDSGNCSKEDIIKMIQKNIPAVEVEYKDLSFGQDMRDVKVSFNKIEKILGFKATITIEEGIKEVIKAISDGLIKKPDDFKYLNHQFIIQ